MQRQCDTCVHIRFRRVSYIRVCVCVRGSTTLQFHLIALRQLIKINRIKIVNRIETEPRINEAKGDAFNEK